MLRVLRAGGVGVTWTTLTVEGVAPDEVTEEFLVEMMDLCEAHGMEVEGIGIDRQESCRI